MEYDISEINYTTGTGNWGDLYSVIDFLVVPQLSTDLINAISLFNLSIARVFVASTPKPCNVSVGYTKIFPSFKIEIAKSIYRKLESPGASDNVPFANNNIRLLEILVDERCPIFNIKLLIRALIPLGLLLLII